MTDEEFTIFATRLFVQYPSLYEWLQRNSPNPQATQELWRDTLRQFRYDECLSVLANWQNSSAAPFAAYERDQVASLLASCCFKNREKMTKKREQDQMRNAVEFHRNNGAHNIIQNDKGMAAAFEKLVPLHKQMLDGELTKEEYAAIEYETLEAM